MRAVILILILVVVVAIGAVATGFLNISPTQPARAPQVAAGENGLEVRGGQPPKFQVDTGKIGIGTGQATVPVPRIEVRPAGGAQQPAQPAPAQPTPAQPAPQPQQGQQPASTDGTQR